jgi:hypothetical protein
VKYWEIIADNLSKAGWSWGCVATVDSNGQTIFVADAHRDNGKRFGCVRMVESATHTRALLLAGFYQTTCVSDWWLVEECLWIHVGAMGQDLRTVCPRVIGAQAQSYDAPTSPRLSYLGSLPCRRHVRDR